MSAQALVDAIAWCFLVYFIALGVFYFLLNACSLLEMPRQLEAGLPELLPRRHSGYEPPVSLIMPAYNEQTTFATAVHSLLQIHYPEFEVIVVNDGSNDHTLEALTREFSLVPFPEAYRRRIETRAVHGVYRSTTYSNLRVIDKENGGTRFTPEEADLYGKTLQDQAATTAGLVTQAAALLEIPLEGE